MFRTLLTDAPLCLLAALPTALARRLPPWQGLWIFHRTVRAVPAYCDLLSRMGIDPRSIITPEDFHRRVPLLSAATWDAAYHPDLRRRPDRPQLAVPAPAPPAADDRRAPSQAPAATPPPSDPDLGPPRHHRADTLHYLTPPMIRQAAAALNLVVRGWLTEPKGPIIWIILCGQDDEAAFAALTSALVGRRHPPTAVVLAAAHDPDRLEEALRYPTSGMHPVIVGRVGSIAAALAALAESREIKTAPIVRVLDDIPADPWAWPAARAENVADVCGLFSAGVPLLWRVFHQAKQAAPTTEATRETTAWYVWPTGQYIEAVDGRLYATLDGTWPLVRYDLGVAGTVRYMTDSRPRHRRTSLGTTRLVRRFEESLPVVLIPSPSQGERHAASEHAAAPTSAGSASNPRSAPRTDPCW